MKAALVRGPGMIPVYQDFAEPTATAGERRLQVLASAISHVARSRASGSHYSSSGQFPFIAGIDGVGLTEDGSPVYFVMPRAPYGAMAEWSVARAEQCLFLPDGLEAVTAAAIANPGMSSWAAYTERARLRPGETVLVNGATGTSGRLAVQIARHLGAGKIIATGRNEEALATVGADLAIALTGDWEAQGKLFRQQFAQGVDVVIDYLWGESAEMLLVAGAKGGEEAKPIRFVQVGSMSGVDITLPSAVLRSSAIELMGSGIGSIPLESLLKAVEGVLHAAAMGALSIEAEVVSLSEVERVWGAEGPRRTVLIKD